MAVFAGLALAEAAGRVDLMIFEVRGADRQTGKNRIARVEAVDADTAERRAVEAGLVVTDVQMLEPEPIEEHDESPDDVVPGFDFAAPAATAAPKSLGYADSVASGGGRVPEFAALKYWSGVLRIVAIALLVIGGFMVLAGLLSSLDTLQRRGLSFDALLRVLGSLFAGLSVVVAAAPVATLGYAAAAFREHVRRHWND